MGPGASEYLYRRLISLSISDYGAQDNNQFPDITLCSIPVPDFISDETNQKYALESLLRKVEQLNHLESCCIALACNTAHILLSDLQKASKTPFISMIEQVVLAVQKDGHQKVGILGTPTTIRSGLYQKAFSAVGIQTIEPEKEQLKILETIIRNVLKGKIYKQDRDRLKAIAETMNKENITALLLGCTELPLIFPDKYSLSVYDSVELLAKALLSKYYKNYQKGGEDDEFRTGNEITSTARSYYTKRRI